MDQPAASDKCVDIIEKLLHYINYVILFFYSAANVSILGWQILASLSLYMNHYVCVSRVLYVCKGA